MKRKKPKQKEDNEFRLEQENRQLKSLNRSLLRELKKRNKGINRDKIDLIIETKEWQEPKEVEIEDLPNVCPSCKRGILKDIDLGIKTIQTCDICQYRGKPKDK